MGYRRMNKRDLWEIYRHWRAGQPLSHIAEAEGRDRKTVREYIARLHELGLGADAAVDQQQFYRRVEKLLPGRNDRPAPAQGQLERHREEIRAGRRDPPAGRGEHVRRLPHLAPPHPPARAQERQRPRERVPAHREPGDQSPEPLAARPVEHGGHRDVPPEAAESEECGRRLHGSGSYLAPICIASILFGPDQERRSE